MWIASGRYPGGGGQFRDCLMRCVPRWIHGTGGTLFEVLVVGDMRVVSAGDIYRAREVIQVWADDPLATVHPDDQETLDRARREREADGWGGDRRG